MSVLSFMGGIHPNYHKDYTSSKPVEKAAAPKTVYIPVSQHIGAPAKPTVKIGDSVKMGQMIAEAGGFVSAPVHASVSGTVKAFKTMSGPGGQKVNCIVIENDFKEEISENLHPYPYIDDMSPEEILDVIKISGIVGMGGATFPTAVKLSPPPDKKVDVVILNGAECEPYLTCDHRLMLEEPENVVYGCRAIMKVLGVTKGYIAIETNKQDAYDAVKKVADEYKNIEVVQIATKYPQGAEKQLIYACTQREVPSGGLPADAGAVVDNVGTAAQIARSLKTGIPFIERNCTVTGSIIKEPKNLRIKLGTLYSEIVEQCGGFTEEPGKVISGGPMMGLAQSNLEVVANKGSGGILCMSKKEARLPEYTNCIRCAKCVEVCPMKLQPIFISGYSLLGNYEKSEEYHALDCIECGCCSYTCPAKRPLLQSIRVAKQEILAKRRRSSKK